jgi:hypothetical protein
MTDAQILKFATAFREGILDGRPSFLMCAAISRPLASLLRLHGLDCEVAEGENGAGGHTWIKLADGRVLDPSADQYNFPCFKQYPLVYLGEPTELHDPELGYSPAAVAESDAHNKDRS